MQVVMLLEVLSAENHKARTIVEIVFDSDIIETGFGEEGGSFDAKGFVNFDYACTISRKKTD